MDRMVAVVDNIDTVFSLHDIKPVGKRVAGITKFLLSDQKVIFDDFTAKILKEAETNQALASVIDKVLIDYVIRNDGINLSAVTKHDVLDMAVKSNQNVYDEITKLFKSAVGMDVAVNKPKDDAVKFEKCEDEAAKGEIVLARPAHLPMKASEARVDGVYTQLTIQWDPDHPAAKRSSSGIEQAIISFVKGLESKKEFGDLGFLGQIHLKDLDVDAGLATAYFRTKKPADALTHVTTK